MFTAKNLVKVLLLLVIFLLVYFNNLVPFHTATDSIDQMDIQVEKSLLAQAPYHLFWFGQKDKTLKLHYNSLLGNQPLSLYALTKKEEIVMAPARQSRLAYGLDKNYSGTVVAVLPPVQVDLNNDGHNERIQLSAKVDTLFAQGLHPPRTTFGDPRIPFEVCFKGHNTLLLLFNNQPLGNQTVRLISRRGFGLAVNHTVTTDAAGMLQVNDIRHLRTGINITYQARDQIQYITSYRLEGRTMFTKYHQEALTPMIKSFQWAVLLAVFLIVGKKVYWWQVRAVLPGKTADRISECFGEVNVTVNITK
jgi:hypothetical protein